MLPSPVDRAAPMSAAVTWGWWLTGLLSAAAIALALHRRRPGRKALGLALAGLFAFFVIGSSPHLVHHLLDPDKGAGCPVYQTTQRVQLTLESPVVLLPPVEATYASPTLSVRVASLPAPTPCGRAPPA